MSTDASHSSRSCGSSSCGCKSDGSQPAAPSGATGSRRGLLGAAAAAFASFILAPGITLRAFAEKAAPAAGARKVRLGILIELDEMHAGV